MARVFVSYASGDRERAAGLHRWLVAEGHEVFLDQDPRDGLVVGEEWEQQLHERLRWADAVVCVITSAFLASQWCTYELACARSRGSRLLPVRAEPGVAHPLLNSAQYADLTGDPDTARAALLAALHRIDAAGGCGWSDDRSPFRGLRPLEVTDHRVFFGRSDEVQRLAALMRSSAQRAEGAVLLVVGPSGCGKSSLVRAGLLFEMAEDPQWWTLPVILPGADPVAGLVRELATAAQALDLDWTVDGVGRQLEHSGLRGLVDEVLLAARARRLLIVVDQAEELLTQTPRAQRARFAQLLRPVLTGPVQVVATLRPEFLVQLLDDPELAAVLPTRTDMLRPLRREALRAVIEGPARLAGIGVDEELVTRLVGDTDSGEALPLLAFTLAELAEGVARGGQLSPQRYEQLGGVAGALTRQADAALAQASAIDGRSHEQVIAGLVQWLVTVDEHNRPTRRRVAWDELPEIVVRELNAFVQQRLIVTDTDQGNVVVGVAHEAFLSAWPPLAQAIADNASALRARRVLDQAARDWRENGHPRERLWSGGQLAAVVADIGARSQGGNLITHHVELDPTAHNFLLASIRRDKFRRRCAVTVLSVLLIAALVGAGVAIVQRRDAAHQRDIAVSQHVAGQALELGTTNPALSAQLAVAAYRLIPTTEARSSVLSVAASPYSTQLTGHTSTVFSVAFSPDGRMLASASGDRTIRLWDIGDLHHPVSVSTLSGHLDTVHSVAFSPDGHTLASASNDQTARLWDISDPHHPAPLGILTGHTGPVFSVAFSPDGRMLASASGDRTIRLWDISDLHHPVSVSTLSDHLDTVHSVAFSPDGRTLASASNDQTARLWDISDPHHPAPLGILTGHTSGLYSVAFSPDGRALASAGNDRATRLWDLPGPSVTGHTNAVRSVAFSPDGHTLATASNDQTARLWDLRAPHQLTPLSILTGHAGTLHSVAFSPDGRALATASDDRIARLWDIRDPQHPAPLGILTGHTDNVRSVAFSPDGRALATASDDRTARLWDIRDPQHPAPLGILTGHTDNVAAVAVSPTGYTLATASNDQTARLWDIHDPHHPTPLSTLTGHTTTVNAVAFSPTGHTLATASDDHTARLWDIRDLHHPTPLSTLTGHTSIVISVAFSPDGHTLATSGEDQTTRLWETNIDNAIARICHTTPSITEDAWNQYLPGLTYQPPCP